MAMTTPLIDPDDVRMLAEQLAETYAGMVRHYQQAGFTPEAQAHYLAPQERLRDAPVSELTWFDLTSVPHAVALEGWARIKQTAVDELRSGHRAVDVLDKRTSPINRARFLALRAALIEEWQPRGAMEQSLIDMLAQIQAAWEYWLGAHFDWTQHRLLCQSPDDKQRERDGLFIAPRVSESGALAQSAEMATRFNGLYLRTLRALRDLRRYAPPSPSAVNINNQPGGQVNVAGQQVVANR